MIYIVDDDKSVRRSFEILLHSAGLKAKAYAGAKEFLNEYKQDENDLIILDIHMPDIDGCELLSILKNKNIRVPVVITTAYDKQESRERAKDYGVIDYLLKPIDGESLIQRISKSINSNMV